MEVYGGPGGRHSHIKYRNMFVQVILFVITLGIYGIYWFYSTYNEMTRANGKTEAKGCLWTFLVVIPIAQYFAFWKHSMEYAEVVDQKYPGIAIFIIWLVFSPIVWFIVQSDLNRIARS